MMLFTVPYACHLSLKPFEILRGILDSLELMFELNLSQGPTEACTV